MLSRGKFTLVQDDATFSQLKDKTKFARPGFELTHGAEGESSKIRINTAVFINFEDYTNSTV